MSKLVGQFHHLLTTEPQYLCLPLKAFVCFAHICLWFPRDCSWRCTCKEVRKAGFGREKLDCREVATKIPCRPWGALELECLFRVASKLRQWSWTLESPGSHWWWMHPGGALTLAEAGPCSQSTCPVREAAVYPQFRAGGGWTPEP